MIESKDNGIFYREQWMKQLCDRMEAIEKRIDTMENNHLPHIEERLNSIERKLAYYMGGIAVVIFVVVWLNVMRRRKRP